MESVPNDFIEDIKRIVITIIDQLEQIGLRAIFGLERLKGAHGSDIQFDTAGNIIITRHRTENLAAAPSTPVNGLEYYNTATKKRMCYIDGAWIDIGGGGDGMTNPATANLDMADYDIIGVDEIKATASQNMAFVVSTGQSIIFQAV